MGYQMRDLTFNELSFVSGGFAEGSSTLNGLSSGGHTVTATITPTYDANNHAVGVEVTWSFYTDASDVINQGWDAFVTEVGNIYDTISDFAYSVWDFISDLLSGIRSL
jgi:dihydrodipicolinate reductase